MKLSLKSLIIISFMFIVGLFFLFNITKSTQETVKKQVEKQKVYNISDE